MMFTIITDFIKANQLYFIIGIIGILLAWHFLAIKTAVDKNNAEWVERIKNAPVQTKTDTVVKFIEKPSTGGSGTAVTILVKDPAVDSLIAACGNKDSLIRFLEAPKTYDTTVTDLGNLALGYKPMSNLFTWELTNRPPVPVKTITITNEKMIPIPFKTFGVAADINGIGQANVGIKQRFNDFLIGIDYQVAGPSNSTVWSEKLQLDVTYFIW
jgi:hypothetical protein